jgi:hypothetical protein
VVPGASHEDFGINLEYAEEVLRAASATVDAMGRHVKVETAIQWGQVDTLLTEESVPAAMICVGSVGIGRVARKFLGSTAGALAEGAHCPVAIIRSDGQEHSTDRGYIAVTVSDDFDNDAVVHMAMQEARLRTAPLLALGMWRPGRRAIPDKQLDRRLGRWMHRYPDVHVDQVPAPRGAAGYLETTSEPVRLVVVGRADALDVARFVGSHNCPGVSVLVARS